VPLFYVEQSRFRCSRLIRIRIIFDHPLQNQLGAGLIPQVQKSDPLLQEGVRHLIAIRIILGYFFIFQDGILVLFFKVKTFADPELGIVGIFRVGILFQEILKCLSGLVEFAILEKLIGSGISRLLVRLSLGNVLGLIALFRSLRLVVSDRKSVV
jgi:hypothetical protein